MTRRCTYCPEQSDNCRPTDGACPRCVPVITAAGVFGEQGAADMLRLLADLDAVKQVVNGVAEAGITADLFPDDDTDDPVSLRYVDGRLMQCKDIPDAAFVDAVRARAAGSAHWAMAWDVLEELEETVGPVPRNLFFAKARRLVARGLIGGCPCGCRGDFHVPEACIDPSRCCNPAPVLTVVS
ncbi:hypothetical protein [Streptomyces sp. NBC_00847]|uniref:hypothetical protein n=1 Tax=Streptomyces sp. NBC_00847 TaxID=2975850 RepID=UPI00225E2F76|nr:hypothetical protein [Streptomyces sp. NBC_00847]MCX4886064.1 hypothetical protein [Streptomyces sp. NBC_00847]